MKLSFKSVVSSTALLLASATTFNALAQTPAAPNAPASGARQQGKGMKEIDTNKDQLISRDEAKGKPRLIKNFDAVDTNKDNQLSRNEMMTYRKAHKGEHKGEGKGQPKS